MRNPRTLIAAGALLAAVLTLAACTGSGADADPAPPVEDDTEPSTSTQEPVDPLAECVAGTWQLDTADYLAQSSAYLIALGIPLDSLDVAGGQQLTFADDGFVTQSTDLTWTGTVMGYTLTVPSQSVGDGAWGIADGTLAITDWNWTVDPADAPPPSGLPADTEAPELPGFSLEGLVAETFECTADTLILQGPGAPLRGVFLRFG